VSITRFEDAEQKAANDARLTLEIELNKRRIDHEVVLLQADDENALRRTHRRYFEDLAELVKG
jgi:hypothetical protein